MKMRVFSKTILVVLIIHFMSLSIFAETDQPKNNTVLKVEESQPASPLPDEPINRENYINEENGFSIVWPKGWTKDNEGPNPIGFSIAYRKDKEPSPVMDLPVLGVTVSAPQGSAGTPLEMAHQMFGFWKATEKKYNIAEPPSEIKINGLTGAKFLWDKPAWDKFKNQEFWVRILNAYFMSEGKLYTINAFFHADQAQQEYPEIDAALKTFRLLPRTQEKITSGVYTNPNHGFAITVPNGWLKQHNHRLAIVEFAKEGKKLPIIGITSDDVSQEPRIKTALDFTRISAAQCRQNPRLAILEEPKEIALDHARGSMFSFGPAGAPIKGLFYQFLINREIITVNATYQDAGDYDEVMKIISSFTLLGLGKD